MAFATRKSEELEESLRIFLVNPIGATPDLTLRTFFDPSVPSTMSTPESLRETNIVELGGAIADLGNRVTVVVGSRFLSGKAWTISDRLDMVPVPTVMEIPFHPALFPITPSLARFPAFREADIVQTGEFHQPATYFTCRASEKLHFPVVLWQETFTPMRPPGSLYQVAHEMTAGRYVRSVAVRYVPRTSQAAAYLRNLGVPERALAPWIPTGIDTHAFVPRESHLSRSDFGWSESDDILLLVSRLHRAKGVDFSLSVLRRLLKDRPNTRLIIRGSGPESEHLQRLAADLGLMGLVRFLGRRSRQEMVDLYNLADIVLCTSRLDLLPFSLIEAAGCGRPCVTTDVGAVRDIVVDGQTGVVVPHRDAEAFSETLSHVLRDEGSRRQMGNAARKRAEAVFDMASVASRLVSVYEAALSG